MKPTNFQITGISNQISKHTGKPVFAVFFKADDGLSYRTWLDEANGNFKRWEKHLHVDIVLTNLKIKAGRLIDADSYPKVVDNA